MPRPSRLPIPRRARRLLAVLLLGPLCAGLGGCGAPEDQPADLDPLLAQLTERWAGEDEEPRDALIERIGRLARAHPKEVIPRLVERLRTERADQQFAFLEIEIDYSDSRLDAAGRKADARAARDVIVARLRQHLPPAQVQVDFRTVNAQGFARIELRLLRAFDDEAQETKRLETLCDMLARPGRLDLALVVERPAEGQAPASLWEGTAAAYDAFVARYRTALAEARRAGRYVTVGEGPLRLAARRPPKTGEAPGVLVVRLSGEPAERFTQHDLTLRSKLDPVPGTLVLEMEVHVDRRAAFEAWCARNAGRRLGVLVDGQAELVLPVPKDAAAFRYLALGSKNDEAADRMLHYIVSAIRPGTIGRPVRCTIARSDPKLMRTPISAALVEAGLAADEPVAALLEAGGTLARRARWIREQIRKRAREASE